MHRPAHPPSRLGPPTTVLGRVGLASLLLALCVPAAEAVAPQGAASPAPADGAVAGQSLRGIFIDLAGKVQWRASDKDAWRDAKVNDSVEAGVEVRTGLRSHAAIRMRNATVLLDAGTMFQLPQAVQDGEVLRTTAAVKHGRADFKVDKVGLSNDFKVVTPSTTLAVRGTGFAVATGPLKQVEVVGARRNAINAIELKYALNNSTVQLSGGAASSSGVNHPAHVAAVTASPPMVSASMVPSVTQSEVVQSATGGEAPTSAGSASQVQSASRATGKSEKAREIIGTPAASSGGTGSGSSSAAARIRAQIERANRALEQSIAYLIQADGQVDEVELRRDALTGLRELASARRAEAQAALAAHHAALVSARAAEAGTQARDQEFRGRSQQVQQTFGAFDSTLSSAKDSLDAIRAILAAGQAPPDHGEVGAIADALRATLAGLGTLNSSALAQGAVLSKDRDAIVDAVGLLGSNQRAAALAAVAAYDAALSSLAAHVAAGESEYQVAVAARDAVDGLRALVAGLSSDVGTQALREKAEDALARLQSASNGLSSALAALESVRAARREATDDARAAELGQVEAIYQRLVAIRVRVIAEWSGISAGIGSRDGEYRTALQDSAALLEQLGDRYRNRATSDAAVAAYDVAAAKSLSGVALSALTGHEQALAAAGATEKEIIGAGEGEEPVGAEARFDLAAGRLAGHFEDFAEHRTAALDVIALIEDILRQGTGGGGQGPGGGSPQFSALGGDLPGGGTGTGGGNQGGTDELAQLIDQLRGALLALGDSRDGAAQEHETVIGEANGIAAAVAGLDGGARLAAQQAVQTYQAAVANLDALLQAGGSRAEAAMAAGDAVNRLRTLVQAIRSGAPAGVPLDAAQRALARLEQAASGFAQSVAALDAIGAARQAATDDERAAALGQVQSIYERVLEVRVRVLAEAAELDGAFGQLESEYHGTLLAAEEAIGGAGQEYAFRATTLSFEAGFLAGDAEGQVILAQQAAAEREAAAGHAEEFESWALDVARVEDLAAQSIARLDAIGQPRGTPAFAGAVDGALESLDVLDEALVAVVARVTDPGSDFGARLPGLGLGSLADRAADAMDALLGAESRAQQAADDARLASTLAGGVGADAARLVAVAQELKQRFGISDELARAASEVVSRMATSSEGAATRAEDARTVVTGLRLAAESDRLGSALGRLEQLVNSREWDSAAGLDLLARAEGAHAQANERGAVVFSSMAVGARQEMAAVESAGQASFQSLQQMASASSEMVAALDGAEGAKVEAERLEGEAAQFRALAEQHEAGSAVGLARTGAAIDEGDLAGAGQQSQLTGQLAALARTAADDSGNRAQGAKAQSDIARARADDVARVQSGVLAFGSNRNQFQAAAAARRSDVQASSSAAESLRQDVAFYDGVVQVLAERADTVPAGQASAESADARVQAVRIASELASAARSAATLEQTASSNAERLFGRSVSQYVGLAQAAAQRAENQARGASQAADRAQGNAIQAAALVTGAGQGSAAR